MSILEQVLELGAQLTPEERQQVIDAWREDAILDAVPPLTSVRMGLSGDVPLNEATKQYLDEMVAKVQRGEGNSIPADVVMARIRARLKS